MAISFPLIMKVVSKDPKMPAMSRRFSKKNILLVETNAIK